MKDHIILFDERCPLCHKAVRSILEIDRDGLFLFSSLEGKIAQDLLVGPQKKLKHVNSVVLVEHYASTERQYWIRSHAMLRVFWLIGRGWQAVGWLSFLPKRVGDFFYRWVAEHRHQFKLEMPEDPIPNDRWVP
jgi:predicted DCC family thiol-disulfide oxidoreductase YuxK